jgi:hypothetical protein
MKRALLFFMTMVFGFAVIAQNAAVKSGIPFEKINRTDKVSYAPQQNGAAGQEYQIQRPAVYKSTDAVSIISIGTSANAYSYGYAGGQKSILAANNDINTVSHFHRMGGTLDPGGYSGDLGYDISTDGGMTWTNMVECYTATNNAGGEYYTDAARYPNHGIYNPMGNTDPNEAFVTFFAPTLDGTNGANSWGGYGWGRAKIGGVNDTTKHLESSDPNAEKFQYIPDAYTVTDMGDFWVADLNQDWRSGGLVWMNETIISHGIWDAASETYTLEQEIIDCETLAAASRPALQKLEFTPDGQIGYIVVLSDNGSVDISSGMSYYPILWRTEDGGQTWSDPIPVAIAGEDGIIEVQNYLSDEEIAELYLPPLPAREEIPFTTAFDFDLSVDAWGNPQIGVICGVSVDAYTIATGISPSSRYAFTSVFLLSSSDKGNEGSWVGHQMGRPVSFRGTFGTDFTEDNRTQICRSHDGTKMFVAWLDTDTTVAAENTAPDIWCRGFDLVENAATGNENGADLPTNVTYGSEGMFQAKFGIMSNRTIEDGAGNYTIPFTYQEFETIDQITQYKYIQDFKFNQADFIWVGINDTPVAKQEFVTVSQTMPNPAASVARFNVTLAEAATVNVTVTNMMGQTVQALPANKLQAGVNELQLNVSNLSSGVYFYTVEAGKEAVTKKMIVK